MIPKILALVVSQDPCSLWIKRNVLVIAKLSRTTIRTVKNLDLFRNQFVIPANPDTISKTQPVVPVKTALSLMGAFNVIPQKMKSVYIVRLSTS